MEIHTDFDNQRGNDFETLRIFVQLSDMPEVLGIILRLKTLKYTSIYRKVS